MQTFLPYRSFEKSASVLDNKRLGKQRVEAWQIYLALTQPGYGWQHHPAVKMWKGYEIALLFYGLEMCHEWINRGYKDTLLHKFMLALQLDKRTPHCKPPWINSTKLHVSHRSNLLRKNPQHYRILWPKFTDKLPYYWPVK